MMGDLLGSFPGNMRVRTKHAEKIYGVSWRSLKPFSTTVRNQGRGSGITDVIRADPRPCAVPMDRRVLGSHLTGKIY